MSNATDVAELARQALAALQFAEAPAGAVAASVGGSAVWDWIKARFGSRSAAAAAAAEAVEKPSCAAQDWEVLRLQLLNALKEDDTLRLELARLLPAIGSGTATTQTNLQSGVGNTGIQIAGSGNKVER